MERHTYSVNFFASPSKARKNGLIPIYVTIGHNRERATFTTGKYIHPSEWDSVKLWINMYASSADISTIRQRVILKTESCRALLSRTFPMIGPARLAVWERNTLKFGIKPTYP